MSIPCNGEYNPPINTNCDYSTNFPQLTNGQNNTEPISTNVTNCTLYTNNIINIPLEIYKNILCTSLNGNVIYFKNISSKSKKIIIGFNMKVQLGCATTSKPFICQWGFRATGNIVLYIYYGTTSINENNKELANVKIEELSVACNGDQLKYFSKPYNFDVPISSTTIGSNQSFIFVLKFQCTKWEPACLPCGPTTTINLNQDSETTWKITFFNYVDA